ncbi:MAG TPA: sugar phosphate isomerase/epimerase family protein [Phycisphaeraceae bacterium]
MSWILSALSDEAGAAPQEQVRALREAGIRYVDLRSIGEHNIASLPVDQARELQQMLQDAGVRVQMFASPIGKIDISEDFQADLDRLNHLGELASVFNCHSIRIFSYFNRAGRDKGQWQSQAIDRLTQLADRADRLGLTLYHENERHIFGETLARVQAIAEAFHGRDTFKFIFDFDNYVQAGEDPWDNWLALRDRTDAIHLKDSTRQGVHVPAGQGDGRVREILSDALKRNWRGPLTLEPHLVHSAAVVATGPSGSGNEQLKDLGPYGCFQLAAREVHKLLRDIGAELAD